MGIIELVLVAIGLSMDAFAVSICKGLNMTNINYKNSAIIAVFFGGFQALMPLIGWFVGSKFADSINSFDHWIAFGLLVIIGGKMIYEAIRGGEDDDKNADKLNIVELFILAIATSIDALAVGVTFALLEDVNIPLSITLIGVVTFAFSFVGVSVGNRFGNKYEKRAEIVGGTILVVLGIKILLEHLGFLG